MKRTEVICKPTLFNQENIFHEIIGKIGWIKWPKIIETSLKAYSSVVIILMCVTFWIRVCFGKYPRALTFDHMSSQWYLVGQFQEFSWKYFLRDISALLQTLILPLRNATLQLTILSVDDGWLFCWHLLLCVHSEKLIFILIKSNNNSQQQLL